MAKERLSEEEISAIMQRLSRLPRTACITTLEAAVYSGMSESTLEKARRIGTGPVYVRSGARAVRYRLVDIDEYNESRRARSTSEY
jgi:predicted DNA-binding transcriptional regulator AlpA